MSLRVLIPVRPFEDGKQRLAGRLSPLQRHALNQRFFLHVLDVIGQVAAAADCIVVSHSDTVLAIAHGRGMQALREQGGGGLNAALDQAAAFAAAQGATGVLSVSCDLPELCADDLRAMVARAAPGRVVLASDRTCSGTNALLVSPPQAIGYHYGPGSRHRHRMAALDAGLVFEAIHRHGLANDVDTPADLHALETMTGREHTASAMPTGRIAGALQRS